MREGVNREAYYYDCKWHDRLLYSMLESEWIVLQGRREAPAEAVLTER